MKIADKNIILTVIKIFLVISSGALITTFYGLSSEKKIEQFYDKIEDLRSANVDLNDWSLTFSGNLSDMSAAMSFAKQKYELEKSDYNYCSRINTLSTMTDMYEWFFEIYRGVLSPEQNKKFNFNKKEEEWRQFKKIESDIIVDNVCLLDEFRNDRDYILKMTPYIMGFQSDFLLIIHELRSVNFYKEKDLYQKINELSERSSNIYLGSFLIQIFLSMMVIALDLYTNRGSSEN